MIRASTGPDLPDMILREKAKDCEDSSGIAPGSQVDGDL